MRLFQKSEANSELSLSFEYIFYKLLLFYQCKTFCSKKIFSIICKIWMILQTPEKMTCSILNLFLFIFLNFCGDHLNILELQNFNYISSELLICKETEILSYVSLLQIFFFSGQLYFTKYVTHKIQVMIHIRKAIQLNHTITVVHYM